MKKQKQHECIVWDLIIEMTYWLKEIVLKSYGYIYIYIYILWSQKPRKIVVVFLGPYLFIRGLSLNLTN